MITLVPQRDAALGFADRGWHVFPLATGTKGKHPGGSSSHYLPNGFTGASSCKDQVREWWTRWPDANIGLSLAASGLVAIDADLYKDDCGWDDFMRHRTLPATFTQTSPRGGRHYVFQAPDNARFPGQLCRGVDIKHRGYILLAPSTFENMPYRITSDLPPTPCPRWLLEAAPQHPKLTNIAPDDVSNAPADEVIELLSWIDPDAEGYAAWIETLQALHAHFGSSGQGLTIAENWSRGGSKFQDGEVPAKWAGFRSEGGVTLASIANRARQSGADLSEIARRHKTTACPRPSADTSLSVSNQVPQIPDVSHDALALALGQQGFDTDAKYVATQDRWYFWTGTHWSADDRLQHLTRIRAFLRRTAQAISGPEGAQPSRELTRQISHLKSNANVSAVAALARANPASVAVSGDFDRDLWRLGTPGGTVDLRNGRLDPARKTDLITRQTICGPAEIDVTPMRWLSFLDDVMDGDQQNIAFLQRAAGYALTGLTREHKLLFLHGSGRNGKSVFLNTLLHIWGEYGRRVAANTFLSSPTERHPTDIAGLRGARLAIASELPRGKTWDEAVIKDLTGGDRMSARFMRQDYFDFDPQLTLLIAGNTQPSFRGIDEAIRSRVVLVPFTVTIPPDKQDKTLETSLRTEAPAILRWCIEGAISWQKAGLDVPPALLQASQDYFDDEDIIRQFLADQTRNDPDAFVSSPDLILRFNHWTDVQGLQRWSQRSLVKELKSRGFTEGRTSRHRGVKGLSFK